MELAAFERDDARAREVFLQQEAILRQAQLQHQGGYRQQPEELPPAYAPNGGYPANNNYPPNDHPLNNNFSNNQQVLMGLDPQPIPGGGGDRQLMSPQLAQLVLGLSQPSVLQANPQQAANYSPPQAYAMQHHQQQQQAPVVQQQQYAQPIPVFAPPAAIPPSDNGILMGLNPQPATPSLSPQDARPLMMGRNVQEAKIDFLPCDAPPEYKFQKGVGCAYACSKNQHFRALCLSLILLYLLISFMACGLTHPEYCNDDATTGCVPSSLGMRGFCLVTPRGPVLPQVIGWIILAIAGVLYIVECCRSSSLKFLSNIETTPSAQYIDEIRRLGPVVTMSVQCWHNELRVKTVQSGGGGKENREVWVRVDTHSASAQYPVLGWEDGSDGVPVSADFCLLKANFEKTLAFATLEAKAHFNEWKENFKQQNKLDTQAEFKEEFTIDGFKPRTLCLIDPKARPWYISPVFFWIFSLLLLTVPYRLKFDSMTGRLTYTFVKVITL